MSIRMTIALPVRKMKPRVVAALVALVIAAVAGGVVAQNVALVPPKKQQKRAAELIKRQEPPKVIPRVLERAMPENISIYISLGKQRAYFRVDDEIAVDTPISSGKRAGMTPAGSFAIMEKDADHRSNLYGDFANPRTGRVVRAGVSTRIDSAPSGTVYRGAPMRWFMRLSAGGLGMHTGILPGYPASHGCVRLPEEIAKLFYDRVKIGTPVTIGD
jgi:lipoprotein-anchoring transpeptidase ErfK/SrfK